MQGGNQKRLQGTESGYALLLIMFFLAVLVVSLAAASPTIINTIQRERETEMIWRGKQYERGIRLYYAKMKRLPGSLDDLTKPGAAGLRFMRQAYKDPVNQVDGSWRLIYMGPNGQLIGSSIGSSALGAPSSSFAQQAGAPSIFPASTSRGSIAAGTNPNPTTAFVTGNGSVNESSMDDAGQPQSLAGPMDASNTIGGNIIGVGSKVNKKSLITYHGMHNYRHFEFIFDRSTVGSAPAGIGTAVQNSSGVSPANAGVSAVPASSAGDWVNQMLPGSGIQSQTPPLPVPPQNQ